MDYHKTLQMSQRGYRWLNSGALPHTPISSNSSNSNWSSHSTASAVSTDSTTFWTTPPKRWKHWTTQFKDSWRLDVPGAVSIRRVLPKLCNSWSLLARGYKSFSIRRRVLLFLAAVAVLLLLVYIPGNDEVHVQDVHSLSTFQYARPILAHSKKNLPDPIRWLKDNSNNKYAMSDGGFHQLPVIGTIGRPRAALISLVRNSELEGIMQSIRQLEYRWNRKYQVNLYLSIQHRS